MFFSIELLFEFAFSDKLASAARKVIAVSLTGTWAAGTVEGVVVNKDAIRTPVMLHVACQRTCHATI